MIEANILSLSWFVGKQALTMLSHIGYGEVVVVEAVFTSEVPWEDPDGAAWSAVFYWANQDGRARLIGVDLHGFPGRFSTIVGVDSPQPAQLTALKLRAFPLGRLADQAYRQIVDQYGAEAADESDAAMLVGAKGSQARKRRKVQYSADHWTELARVYRSAPDPRKPTKAVADHFNISHSAAAKQVARAREMRLLEETTQGVAQSPPGPKPPRRRGPR